MKKTTPTKQAKASPVAKVMKVPIVSNEEARLELFELKTCLIENHVSIEKLRAMFNKFGETISSFELSRALKRKPISFPHDAIAVARFLVEPRGRPEIEANDLAEETTAKVLDTIIKSFENFEEPEPSIKQAVCSVIKCVDNRIEIGKLREYVGRKAAGRRNTICEV